MFNFLPGAFLQFEYMNHRGRIELRHVEFRGMQVGQNEHYREPALLLHCYDFDREAPRSFAVGNINPRTIAKWIGPRDAIEPINPDGDKAD